MKKKVTEQNNPQLNNEPNMNQKWLAILTGIILCILVLILWWFRHEQENGKRQKIVESQAIKLSSLIEADLQNRIQSLQRIVNRWEIRKGIPEEEFIYETQAYVAEKPGFQALEWVDRTYHVRFIVPYTDNEEALNLDNTFEINRKNTLEKAENTRTPAMTPPVDLVQGGKGFLIYFPIFVDGDFDGFVLAAFRIQEWMDFIFNNTGSQDDIDNFKISVLFDNSPIYKQYKWDSSKDYGLDENSSIEILNHRFTVLCKPTPVFIAGISTYLDEIIVIIGLVLSIFISFILYLFQKASNEVWRTYLAKKTLEEVMLEHKKTKEMLQITNSRLTLATKAGNIGVWILDLISNELVWDDIIYKMYDVPPDVKPNYDTWRRVVHPDDIKKTEQLLEEAIEGKAHYETEFRIVLQGGIERNIHSAARVERDRNGKPLRMTGVNWDITKQKKAEEKIQHLANHDALTNLPSLRLARDRANMAIQLAKRNKLLSAVMFIDLDGFKDVNDNFGHDAGDSVLIEISKRLKISIRKTDTASRIGGDEFLIVLSELHKVEDAEIVAKKIIQIVSIPFTFRGSNINLGVSIGIAVYPENGDDVENLIKLADDAMYEMKRAGKNGYIFSLISE